MFLFVSDLHLTDEDARRSFDAGAFLRAIEMVAQPAYARGEQVSLVLLGDIFELLKSDRWFGSPDAHGDPGFADSALRPWHKDRQKVAIVGRKIIEEIGSKNEHFFAGLQALRQNFGVKLNYLPGNHDGLVADMKVPGMREAVRKLIPGLPGCQDQEFDSLLIDFDHGLVAEHGHQLDEFNLPVDGGPFVPGDAVVVEILVRLPRVAAAKLGASPGEIQVRQFSEAILFLQELDNVIPQDLPSMLLWLELRVAALPPAQRSKLESVISESLRECAKALRGVMKAHRSNTSVRRALWALTVHERTTQIRWLRRFSRISFQAPDQNANVIARIGSFAALKSQRAQSLGLYIAGHTHATLQNEFGLAFGRRMTYLNTGTWRRVQTPARSLEGVAFQRFNEETLLAVHPVEASQTRGRYEFYRYVRG